MASSDDEGETVPQSVANYDFVDEKDEPVSFAALPIKWSEHESPDGMTTQMFLHGTADSGLQKVYKQVSAWKFELSCEQPEISVLSKENKWIKLQKPRKSFEETIRTILITLHCLHFAKKNPETSAKSLWDHLLKVFSLYEVPPSENDLLNHWRLMSEAVKRDETLSKCKFLTTFVEEKPRKRKPFDEVFQAPKKKFIVDDDDEDESDEEGDLFDSVCAICDNGGELLCCEGRCMRSFHATVDAGSESLCKSLGFSDDQVEAIQNFLCLNCQYKQHQCFACGTLGSSDKSLTAEVFPCVSATCGHFYHPECAAKLLHPGNETAAEELEKKIAAGQPFICPVHKCLVCKQGENKKVHELQFAVCRRCPKAYHRKCLPRKIAFEDSEDGDIIQRAWEGLMPNRILIYCLKHKIEDDIGTPVRNHIKFPEDKQKREKCPTELQRNKEKALAKKRRTVSEDSYGEKTAVKAPELVPKVSSAGKDSGSTKKISRTGSDSFTKSTILDLSRKSSKGNSKPTLMRDKSFTADERKVSLGEDELNSQLTKGLEPQFKPKQLETSGSKLGKKKTAKPVTKKLGSSHTLLDADAEKRIMDLMKDVSSSITLDKILQNHELPSTHAYSWKHMVDKTITLGKVEVSVEAVRTALQKLEEGCSIDDARDVCEPEILKQIIKWKNKLKVYLAPFLYGLRYTSYGRHFTKVGKLKEIVDWLHWYVQNGDTIVDFCCGANDFSCLMKKKLEETGKKCAFKNYDLIQPKNDFNFEKRDWMSVHPRELPTGSQLIMGLNPPFGVKASLANKFINKALEFKPKLIILIVPKETERLDEKEAAYDLIWEDGQKLSGKSFYLPGSVDVNDKQMEQWNQKPPPLYLWSRPDWTTKHKAIAQKHGHMVTKELHADENCHDTKVSDNPKEADDDYCADISKLINDYGDDSRSLDYLPEQIGETEKSEEARAAGSKEKKKGLHSNIGNKGGKNHDQGNKRSREDSVDWGDKHKHARGKAEALAANKQDGDRSPQVNERYKEIPPTISSPNRRSLLSHSLEELETPPERAFREGNYSQFHSSGAGMGSNGHGGIQTRSPEEIARRYGGIQNSISEDIVRRYSRNSEDPLPSGTNNWSTGLRHGYEYGLRSFDEPNPSYLRDNADVFGRTSYGGELDEKYRREADIRAQLRLYGRQEADPLSQRSSTYLTSQGSGFGHMGSLSATAYSRIGSASESSSYDRMGLSAMQRYAPQLDELNRARMSNLGSGISPVGGSGGIYDRPGSVPGLLANSMGFAPGPQRPFSDHNSSGWLND